MSAPVLHCSPEYLKLNPQARVPTLLVDDAAATEVVVVTDYLDRLRWSASALPEGQGLAPDSPRLRDALAADPVFARVPTDEGIRMVSIDIMKQGAHAYFAPVRWAVCALRRAAENAFGESSPPQNRIKLS
ncbi:hypothetical protein [Arenimonas fontis]|uniref:Uncharacterized protein n=1 Tax=Arenimonas fontis TaxID=2608255 RepID=A0A5B2ZFJ3_9GAMM|nr:hypothetical protein [Arenimonas fontis]KAA2285964.1 hypothetical protein F0415_00205 [Arenimonas fontis]